MLTTLPMLSPHESLNLNPARGLLAAVLGNPATSPASSRSTTSSQDCRHPVLDVDGAVARFGHESGFSPDGKTFYAAGTALQSITAIDVTDPKQPHAIWQGNEYSHGHDAQRRRQPRLHRRPEKGNLLILDTSQIQARKPNPQAREVSRLTWNSASIPQNAIPFTVHGQPYMLEFDEYTRPRSTRRRTRTRSARPGSSTSPTSSQPRRRLEHPAGGRPAGRARSAAAGDPGAHEPGRRGTRRTTATSPARSTRSIVACSFIASGLRVFDIPDPLHPKEIALLRRAADATRPRTARWPATSPCPSRRSRPSGARSGSRDGTSGFYVLRMADSVWPPGNGERRRRPRSPARSGARAQAPAGEATAHGHGSRHARRQAPPRRPPRPLPLRHGRPAPGEERHGSYHDERPPEERARAQDEPRLQALHLTVSTRP